MKAGLMRIGNLLAETGGRRWLLAVAGVALLVRLAYLWAFRESPLFEIFIGDQRYYRDWALGIAGGDWLGSETFEQGPLYAYLLGAFYRLAGPRDLLALLLQLLSGVGMVILTSVSALRLFDRRTAVVAGLLAAVYGPLVLHEGLIMKTFLEPLLIMAVLYAALRYDQDRRPRWLAVSAAMIGLLCLVREIHVLLLPLLLWAWIRGTRQELPVRRRLAHLAAAALAFAGLLAPATLRNCVVAGECVPVTAAGGEVLYLSFGPTASAYYLNPSFVRPRPRLEHEDFRDEARLRSGRNLTRGEASGYWRREALREALASPGRTLRLAALRLAGTLNDYEYPDSDDFAVTRQLIPLLGWLPSFGWIAGLGILGAVFSLGERRPPLLLLAFTAVCLLEVLLTQAFSRYRLVVMPLFLILAGHAVSRLLRGIPYPTRRERLGLAASLLLALAVSAWSFSPPPTMSGPAWTRWLADDYRAEVAFRSEKRPEVARIRKHLETAPGDAEAWAALGDALAVLGKLPEAIRAQRTALELNPRRAYSAWSLANLLYQEGRFDLAAESARAYLHLAPADARGHLGLAVFCSRIALGTRDRARAEELRREAERHFQEAVRLDPQDPSAFYYRGRFLALSGEWEAARKQLVQALELDPGFGDAQRVLGLVAARLAGG